MINKLIVAAVMLLLTTTGWAGSCRTDSLPQSTPTSQFTISGEVVTDQQTKLTWMRCAIGQHWDGKHCTGKVKTVNWLEAMALVDEINAQGFDGNKDWRMPVVPELASIVERQCFYPRMNTDVFPDAPSIVFWTGMEKMGSNRYAYTLNFGGGEAVASAKQQQGAVRLVRGGPWWKPPMMSQQ